MLYAGVQWKCLPVPTNSHVKPVIHYPTIYKVFAKWADDGSLWQAFVASVQHLAAGKHLDTSVLHGDGTNTVAKKGAMGLKRLRVLRHAKAPQIDERVGHELHAIVPTLMLLEPEQ